MACVTNMVSGRVPVDLLVFAPHAVHRTVSLLVLSSKREPAGTLNRAAHGPQFTGDRAKVDSRTQDQDLRPLVHYLLVILVWKQMPMAIYG